MRNAVRNIITAVTSVFLVIIMAGIVFAADVKVNLKIPGMCCASSGAFAADTARAIHGVRSAVDDWANNILTVVFDDKKTDVKTIKKGLSAAGFRSIGHEVPGK